MEEEIEADLTHFAIGEKKDMRWRKRGLVFAPSGKRWWARSYALLPTVGTVDNDILRIYFASLDGKHYGRIGYVDVDANNPQRILYQAKEPVLNIGELGAFDDSGVNPSCVVDLANKKYLYYIGWQRCERVPYMLFSGLAVSRDGGLTFERQSRTPVLDRTVDEPFSRGAPFVMIEDGVFKMWYWSCLKWSSGPDIHYNTVIRHAVSTDGMVWNSHPHICIEPDFSDEYAVGRPWVIRDGPVYKMWYSIRSFTELYTIGYAESKDGIHCVRKDDEVGIGKSENGWDSEMICYPCVVEVKSTRLMFYNGNRHGSTGFGYAVEESE